MTEAGDEAFKKSSGLVSENFWISVRRYDKNSASFLLHLMKLIVKGQSHYLWHHQTLSRNRQGHMPYIFVLKHRLAD